MKYLITIILSLFLFGCGPVQVPENLGNGQIDPEEREILEKILDKVDQYLEDKKAEEEQQPQPPEVVEPRPELPPEVIEPEPKPDSQFSRHFDHYNPKAWDKGKGSAIVFCRGEQGLYRSCEMNGQEWEEHGGGDEGRDAFTVYNRSGLEGILECNTGSRIDKFKLKGSGKQIGDCR